MCAKGERANENEGKLFHLLNFNAPWRKFIVILNCLSQIFCTPFLSSSSHTPFLPANLMACYLVECGVRWLSLSKQISKITKLIASIWYQRRMENGKKGRKKSTNWHEESSLRKGHPNSIEIRLHLFMFWYNFK